MFLTLTIMSFLTGVYMVVCCPFQSSVSCTFLWAGMRRKDSLHFVEMTGTELGPPFKYITSSVHGKSVTLDENC